jgi:small multidrug resistance pump
MPWRFVLNSRETHMNLTPWLYLGTAIVAEVIGTSALKASDGFTLLWPSVIVVVGYACAFWLLALTLRSIPVGVAYAIWAGLGIVLIALVGVVLFGQKLDAPAIIGMGLIVAGVVVMNVFSGTLKA